MESHPQDQQNKLLYTFFLCSDELFKIRVIGDGGVGKSSLIQRFNGETFQQQYIATIGTDFIMKTVNIDNKIVKLQIWDTAGQERFFTFTSSYFRFASGIILVYDITSRITFKNIIRWVKEIKNNCNPSIQVILIGNKKDLNSERKIPYEQGEKMASKILNGIQFLETCAKTGENVDCAFNKLVENLLKNKQLFEFLPKDILQLSTAKDYLKILGVNEDVFSGNSLAQKDSNGVIHYYPAKQKSPNFQKYCDIKKLYPLDELDYTEAIKKYTSHESLYCTKINLLLAADSNQLTVHAKLINQLQSAIYYYAQKGKYSVKKNLLVYRGIDCSKEEIEPFQENEILYFPSFMSTSSDKNKFYQGANYNTIFIIRFDKIPNCAFQLAKEQSKYEEDEVLFKCYSKFKVQKISHNVTVNGKKFENMIELLHINESIPEKFQNSFVKFFANLKAENEKTQEIISQKQKKQKEIQQIAENKCCKVVIVGSSCVGKTSIIQRYIENSFSCRYCATIGVDFVNYLINFQLLHQKIKALKFGNQNLKLILVSYFNKLLFISETHVDKKDFKVQVLLITVELKVLSSFMILLAKLLYYFQIVFQESFEQLKVYLNQVSDQLNNLEYTKFLLLGNKIDLENRTVQYEKAQVFRKKQIYYYQEFAQKNKMQFKEISAKNGEGVEEAFNHFAQTLISFDEIELPVDLDSLRGKPTLEEMRINTSMLKNANFAEVDKFGIAHFYPQQQFGQNYYKFCFGWQPNMANNEIIAIVNQYTDKETMLCTKINLLLASDSEQLYENAKQIKQLRYSIYKLAQIYPAKVKQVFRGMDGSEKEFDRYPLGKTIYLPSFTSTSRNPDKFYSDKKQNTILIINLKKSPLGAFVVTKKYSKNAENDEEILFTCYSKFKVVKKEMNQIFAGKQFRFYIELESIDQSWALQQQNDQSQAVQSIMFSQFLAIK